MCILTPHYRKSHWVRGHLCKGKWRDAYFRSGSFVNDHCQLRFNF